MSEDNKSSGGNGGWTQYQKLVLDMLNRHDRKMEEFGSQLIEQKLSLREVQVDLERNIEVVKELIAKLEETKKSQSENKLDLTKLQWKFGTLITIISTVIGWVGQAIVKMFLHS